MSNFQYINLDYLEEMSYGDAELKATMLDMLFEEMPTELTKMRQHTEAGEWAELSSVSHKMKSTLSFIGCDPMTEANRNIERATKSGEDLHEVPDWMTRVEQYYELVMPELQQARAAL